MHFATQNFKELLFFHAMPDYHRLVSSAFHSLLRVLFNFPSRYSFAIGLKEYLELEDDDPCFLARQSTHNTLETRKYIFLFLHTRLSLSLACRSRQLLLQRKILLLFAPHLRHLTTPDSVCSLLVSVDPNNSISIDFFSCRY